MSAQPTSQDREPGEDRPHEIEAVLNSGGHTVHYCLVCGEMGVSLAPELPCSGPPSLGAVQ